MNYLIFIEAIVFGIITLMIGTIIFNLTINKNNKNKVTPFGMNIAFFATGFFLDIIFELIGLNDNLLKN
jgi:hypothetical protein